jgi:hypothetical protein
VADTDACGVELDDGTLCDWVPPDDAAPNALGLHRWSKHKVRADGTRGDRLPAHAAPSDPGLLAEPSPFMPPPGPSGEVPPVRGGGGGSAESPPPRARGLLGRFKRKPKPEKLPRQSGPERVPKRTPTGRGKRVSTAATLGDIAGGFGTLLGAAGHVPTARMVAFQAPAMGELGDELVKDTLVDRAVLQPIVRSRGVLDNLFAIAAPGVLTWQLEKALARGDADAVDRLEGALKWAIKESLPTMLPAMKRVREREAKQAAALVEMLEMADLEMLGVRIGPDGQPVAADTGAPVDIGDIFVSMVFAEWVPPAPAEPEARPEEAPQDA